MDWPIKTDRWTVASLLLVVGILLTIFCHFLSSEQSWVHSESMAFKSYFSRQGKEVRGVYEGAFNLEIFDSGPRTTRPLENLFNYLDFRVRSFLWKFVTPHPSLSLHWPLVFLIMPLLFIFYLRPKGQSVQGQLLLLAVFFISPGTIYLVTCHFRSAKVLANFFFILALVLAQQMERKRQGGQLTTRKYLLYLLMIFPGFFVDETTLFLWPLLPMFYPKVFFHRWRGVIYLCIPPFLALMYFVALPLLFFGEGSEVMQLENYEHIKQLRGLRSYHFDAGQMAQNLFLLIEDSLGLFHPVLPAKFWAKILGMIHLTVIIIFWGKALREGISQKKGRQLVAMFWILMSAALFHSFLMLFKTRVWGILWYGSFFTIIYLVIHAHALRILQKQKTLCVLSTLTFLCAQGYKAHHYNQVYRYFQLNHQGIGLEKIYSREFNPFDPKILKDKSEVDQDIQTSWRKVLAAEVQNAEQLPDSLKFLYYESYWARTTQ